MLIKSKLINIITNDIITLAINLIVSIQYIV